MAVLNESGRLVHAVGAGDAGVGDSGFHQGMRGTLQVTFEEGTHSAWLYDLLVRRVARLVVCNPRKNALLKSGSKSDAIDARKLAELLRAGLLSPVYHGEKQRAGGAASGAQLYDADRRHDAGDGTVEGGVSRPGDGLRGQEAVRQTASRRVAGAVGQRRTAAARRASLPGAGRLAAAAPRGPARPDRGVPQACGGEVAAVGSVSGTAARGGADRTGADTASLPHQAPVLGLLRAGAGDARQRRIPRGRRTGGTPKEAGA